MVKRTITITSILLILTMAVGLIGVLDKPSFGADDIASGTCGTCSWVVDSEGVLTISPTDGISGTLDSFISNNTHCWQAINLKEEIKKVIVEDGVKTGQGCYHMFEGLTNCIDMDLSGLDTSDAISMDWMFYSCKMLTSIDVSRFDTSNVTNMNRMFGECNALNTIDVSNFNTSNVTNMSHMFADCKSLTSIDLTSFDTSKVTNMDYMFYCCDLITTIDVSSFDTIKVTNMNRMFGGCNSLTTIEVSNFNTSNVTNMTCMFAECYVITTIDVSGFDTKKVTDMSSMFRRCKNLNSINVSNFNTENVTNMNCMFWDCNTITYLDLSSFNTSLAIDMNNFFLKQKNLDKVNLGESFNFDGRGDITYKALLPTPTGEEFTGKWIREDKVFGPYTPEELRDNYDGSTMAGIWIRERKPLTVTYSYTGTIPEGASELPEARTYGAGEIVEVAPDAIAPGYTFSGWSRTGTFEMPTEDVLITGSFTAVTDTANNTDEEPEEPSGEIKDDKEKPLDIIKDEAKEQESIVESKIEKIKGEILNPKTSDFIQNYLIYGIAGIGILAVVMRLRRKHGRKAKKIQY